MPELVPIRWGRMSASPFALFRGAALTMAADLATTPSSGLRVQLCGDAHLMNFGVFAAPDRTLIFDVTDFDETLPGPWEWDVKRLAASVAIAARERGFTEEQGCDAALAVGRSYREWMDRYARMSNVEVWYSRVAAADALALTKSTNKAREGREPPPCWPTRSSTPARGLRQAHPSGRRPAALHRQSTADRPLDACANRHGP